MHIFQTLCSCIRMQPFDYFFFNSNVNLHKYSHYRLQKKYLFLGSLDTLNWTDIDVRELASRVIFAPPTPPHRNQIVTLPPNYNWLPCINSLPVSNTGQTMSVFYMICVGPEAEYGGYAPDPEMDDEGWASWAWSYVPQILPAYDENELGEYDGPRRKPQPGILSVGFYVTKASIIFKVRSQTTTRHTNSRLSHN